ncbi:MAG TPA: HAD hydrolase-like protein, partial [Noviherbaspirillum sp.]|nr:HAD hydrolase-like protein [Noviherbaspirillum sp.]
MRYRLAVFDFDGTLADSFAFFLDTLDTLADEHGFRKLDRSQLDILRTLDARAVLKHVGLPLWKAPRVGAHYKRLMAAQAHRIPLFDGTDGMLRQLAAQGAALAILSSNSEENVRTVLGPELGGLFALAEQRAAAFVMREQAAKLRAED